MAINIKSPAVDVLGKGKNPSSKGSSGEYNGEPGYQKRTSTPNGPPEKTYDGVKPSGSVSIKSPGTPVKK